jgi:hypothetical protein
MSETDVLGLDVPLRELREGLRRMELRAEQYVATLQTLTRQMAQQDIEHQDRLAKLELRLTTLAQDVGGRFDRIETMLAELRRERL